jgi:hypothetical protein
VTREEELERRNKLLEEQGERLEQQVAILTQQVDYLKRQLYGSKSERIGEHPELFEADEGKPGASSAETPGPEGAEEVTGGGAEGRGERRRIRAARLPENLPVVETEVLPAEVLADPAGWRRIGEETSDQLEKEPGYFYLHRTVFPKFVREDDPPRAPVRAPAPARIIECGFWGAGLLAEILSNRYLYHLPYYRQEV